MPAKTRSAFVVTHSKPLLKQLAAAEPHYVVLGTGAPATLAEWLATEAAPRDIEQLADESHKLFKRISRILKS